MLQIKNGKLDLVQLSVQIDLENINLETKLSLNNKEIAHNTTIDQDEYIVVLNEIQLIEGDTLTLLIKST